MRNPTTRRDQLEADMHDLDMKMYQAERTNRPAAELAELYHRRALLWHRVAATYPDGSNDRWASVMAEYSDEQAALRLIRLTNLDGRRKS